MDLSRKIKIIKKSKWTKKENIYKEAVINNFEKTNAFLNILNFRLSFSIDVVFWYEIDKKTSFVEFKDKNFNVSKGYDSNTEISNLIAKCHEDFKNQYESAKESDEFVCFTKCLKDNNFVVEFVKHSLNGSLNNDGSVIMMESMLYWDKSQEIDKSDLFKIWNNTFLEKDLEKYDSFLGQKISLFLNEAINDIYSVSQRCIDNVEEKQMFRFVFIDEFTIEESFYLEEYLRGSYINDKLEETQVLFMQLVFAHILDNVSDRIALIIRDLWFFYGFFVQSHEVMLDEMLDIYMTFLVRMHKDLLEESNKYLVDKTLQVSDLKNISEIIEKYENKIGKDLCKYLTIYLKDNKIF